MMKKAQKGFTLIELMIVVAIIGILAAVAIPAYQNYIARAQVSEAVTLLGGAKTPLAEYFADNGSWPAALGDVVPNTSGTYVGSLFLDNADASTQTVDVVARMRATGVNTNIQNGTLAMKTTNGGNTWTCEAAGTSDPIGAEYLPGACK